MLMLMKAKISEEDLQKVAEDLDGYIKVVVDVEKRVMTAGGAKHVDGKQMLLQEGNRQEDLWGGGLDLETGEIDFDSMINIRPNQNNPSREVLSEDVRSTITEMVREFLQ